MEVRAWGRRCTRYWLVCGGDDPRTKAKFMRDITGDAKRKVMVKGAMIRANMARQLRTYLSEAEEMLTLDQLCSTRAQLPSSSLSATHSLDCRPVDWTSRCGRAGRKGALTFLEEAFRREVQEPGDGRVDIASAQRVIGAVSRGLDDGDLSARQLIPDVPTIKRAVLTSRGSDTNCERVDLDTCIRLVEAASRSAPRRSRWKLAGDEAAQSEAARAGKGPQATQKLARWETHKLEPRSNSSAGPSTQVVRRGFESGPVSLWVSRSGSSEAAEEQRATLRELRHIKNEVTGAARDCTMATSGLFPSGLIADDALLRGCATALVTV